MTLAARIEPLLPDRIVGGLSRLLYRRFEPELRWLDVLCPHGRTAVDVGAWYGPWTMGLARLSAAVVSVEPMPRLAELLARSAPPNVRVVAAAASDQVGSARMWTSADGRGVRGVSALTRRPEHGVSVDVDLITLDSLVLRDVGFVKVDVEGHEIAALRGGRDTILRERPLLLVEAESRLQPIEAIVDLVTAWGYRPFVLLGDRWTPLTEFDIVTHQRKFGHAADRGLLARAIWPRPRYVNLLLFAPDDGPTDPSTLRLP